MKISLLWSVLAFLGGLVLGSAAVTWLPDRGAPRPRSQPPGAAPEASSASEPRPSAPLVPARQPAAEARDEAAIERREDEEREEREPVFGSALREYARAELERGWAEVRHDRMPAERLARLVEDYGEVVRTTPAAWGRRAAEEQSEREASAQALDTGDAIGWLGNVARDDPERLTLAEDAERFAGLFRPRGGGTAHDGPTLAADAPLDDGAVLVYPAGVFRVADLARGRETFPSDVTLRGAGMNLTLLVMDELNPRGALERFSIEDCTVFAESGIADVRSAPSVVALRRMRLVGFDCGAGGSCAMYLSAGCALSAVHCRFEGGYGRNPGGYANLMRGASPLVARFDRCVFERMSLEDATVAGVVFDACTMTDMLAEPPAGPAYRSCNITALPAEQRWDAEVRRRDLDDLFPGWRERLTR